MIKWTTCLTLLLIISPGPSLFAATYELDWYIGISPVEASATISVGDTVRWTWKDSSPHSVQSKNGATINSAIMSGNGQTFSHTFTSVGLTDYKCGVHSSMVGTISVEAVSADIFNDGFEAEKPVTD